MCRNQLTTTRSLWIVLATFLVGACTGYLTQEEADRGQETADGDEGDDAEPLDASNEAGAADVTPADQEPLDPDGGDGPPADDTAEADEDPAGRLNRDMGADAAADPDTAEDGDAAVGDDDVVLGCSDHAAQVVSHTIPASIGAGDHATASVTIANSGRSTWTEAGMFRLGSPGNSDPFVEAARVLLPAGESVSGDPDNPPTYTWVFGMNAPSEGGEYVTDWQMLQENECWFGEVLTRTVSVQGDVTPGVCGPPLPPWEDERSQIKLNCGGAWCDATPLCHGCDFCAQIGLGCTPGTGPEPPCTPRCDCPVRPDGHPERSDCEVHYLGGRPLWRSDGEVIPHPDNDFRANCAACTWIEVCRADGTRCTRVTF